MSLCLIDFSLPCSSAKSVFVQFIGLIPDTGEWPSAKDAFMVLIWRKVFRKIWSKIKRKCSVVVRAPLPSHRAPSHEPSIIQPNTRSPACGGFLLVLQVVTKVSLKYLKFWLRNFNSNWSWSCNDLRRGLCILSQICWIKISARFSPKTLIPLSCWQSLTSFWFQFQLRLKLQNQKVQQWGFCTWPNFVAEFDSESHFVLPAKDSMIFSVRLKSLKIWIL